MMTKTKSLLYLFAAVLAIPPLTVTTVSAQQSEATVIEEIVIIGSRRQDGRSVTESLVPVDVFSDEDLSSMGSTNMDSMLSNLIPSYRVDQQAINDAATLVRPANLRGLAPDSTLVLVNGKRRHRASIITLLGNGVADGSQGPDVSVIPSVALKRVEVLRDGAAAQYGSDAIAGVINFELKDDAEGGAVEARWGQHYKGDGDGFNFAGNVGLPLTSSGFLNLSMEYKEADPTSRTLQRTEAADQARLAGNPYINDPTYDSIFHPTAMVWGAPKFEYDYKFFGNMGIDLSDSFEAYGFGNYAKRKVEGGFYYRPVHSRGGVNTGPQRDVDGITYNTILVADIDADGPGECQHIRIVDPDDDDLPAERNQGVSHPMDLAAVEGDDNCRAFITGFPGGFTPRFGGVMEDYSFAFGVRGELGNDWNVDLSGVYGRHNAEIFMRHTLNPQMLAPGAPGAPEGGYTAETIPTNYHPATYTETDYTINLDVSKLVDIAAFHSPLSIAFGLEHRQEEFKLTQGEEASWFRDSRPGGLAEQGFGVGSNGFPGAGPGEAGTWSRNSYAAYLDIEAELSQGVLLGAAGRYEDHKGVGETMDVKISARGQVTDNFAIRGAVSTGFRAPTVGQVNLVNVTTAFSEGRLADEGTLPATHPAAQVLGAAPLTSEESTNYTLGAVFNVGDMDVTIDYFNIEVQNRIFRSSIFKLTGALIEELAATGFDASGLLGVRYFANDVDTTTQGIDIVATLPFELAGGNSNLSFAGNWTETTVDDRNKRGVEVIDDKRVIQLEKNNPEFRFTTTLNHTQGPWSLMLRGRFYGSFVEFSTDGGIDTTRLDAGSRFLMDAEVGYSLNDNITLVAGAENFIDTTPTNQSSNDTPYISGMQYAETSPYGFNGGFYYFRALYEW